MDDVLSFSPDTLQGNFCATCEQRFGRNFVICPNDGTVFAEVRKIEQLLFNRYQILSTVGSGSTGTIYKGKQQPLGRTVAIKMLKIHDPAQNARFKQEAQLCSYLEHPNIIHVYDFGTATNNQPFMVMDFIDGGDLAELINKEGLIQKPECLQIFRQICDGMGYAHKKGVVHRDLKPSNIMLCDLDGLLPTVRIVDFGIAKALIPGAHSQEQTKTAELFGSPYYMSPEQALGKELDARSDIYSLGCVMYETLTGTLPIAGSNPFNTLRMHITEKPIGIKEKCPVRHYSDQLEHVVMKCLAKDPAKRFQDMDDVRKALDTVPEAVSERRSFSASGVMPARTFSASGVMPARSYAASGVMPAAVPRPTTEPRKRPSLRLVLLTSCLLTMVGGLSAFCLTQFNPKPNQEGKKQSDDLDDAIKNLKKTAHSSSRHGHSSLNKNRLALSGSNPLADAVSLGPERNKKQHKEVTPEGDADSHNTSAPGAVAAQSADRDILLTSSSTNIFGKDNHRIMINRVAGDRVKETLESCLKIQPLADHVYISESVLHADSLEPLRGLKRITHLTITHSSYPEEVLSPLTEMPQLVGLCLNTGKLTDKFVRYLGHMPNLKVLDLTGQSNLTQAALSRLPKSIEDLHLKQDYGLSRTKFAVLTQYPNLRHLSLSDTHISDEGLFDLQKLHQLEVVELCDSAITDDGIDALNKMPNLKELELTNSRVGREGLFKLAKAPQLKYLAIFRSEVLTARDFDQFRKITNKIQLQPSAPNIRHGSFIDPDKVE